MFLSLGSCCIGNIAYHSRLVAEQGFYNDQPGTEAGCSEAWRKEGFLAVMFMESTNVSKKHVSPAFAKPKLGVRCFSLVTFVRCIWGQSPPSIEHQICLQTFQSKNQKDCRLLAFQLYHLLKVL
jgi:hypothetical protein